MGNLQIKKEFIQLLRDTPEVDRHSRYSEVKKKLSSDPRYKAVDSSTTREDWFRDHIKHLKEERKKDKERDRRDRKDYKREEKREKESRKEDKEKDKEKDKDKEEEDEEMPLHDPERSDVRYLNFLVVRRVLPNVKLIFYFLLDCNLKCILL